MSVDIIRERVISTPPVKWVVENIFDTDTDKARKPHEILARGLRGVDHTRTADDFFSERGYKGWTVLPYDHDPDSYPKRLRDFRGKPYESSWITVEFYNKLVTITGEQVSMRVDRNSNLLPPEIGPHQISLAKAIIHTFVYHPRIYGLGGDKSKSMLIHWATTFPYNSSEPDFYESSCGTTNREDIDPEDPNYSHMSPVVDALLDVGIIRLKSRRFQEYLFLTKKVDALLS